MVSFHGSYGPVMATISFLIACSVRARLEYYHILHKILYASTDGLHYCLEQKDGRVEKN
jgi:hypothetical protein